MWIISENKFENKCGKCCCQCAQWYDCFYSCINDEIGNLVYCDKCKYISYTHNKDYEINNFIPFERK